MTLDALRCHHKRVGTNGERRSRVDASLVTSCRRPRVVRGRRSLGQRVREAIVLLRALVEYRRAIARAPVPRRAEHHLAGFAVPSGGARKARGCFGRCVGEDPLLRGKKRRRRITTRHASAVGGRRCALRRYGPLGTHVARRDVGRGALVRSSLTGEASPRASVVSESRAALALLRLGVHSLAVLDVASSTARELRSGVENHAVFGASRQNELAVYLGKHSLFLLADEDITAGTSTASGTIFARQMIDAVASRRAQEIGNTQTVAARAIQKNVN